MSTFLLVGVATALCIPLVTRGSYRRLIEGRWRWPLLLGLGLVLQVAVERSQFEAARYRDLGFGMLVASYVLLLGFCCGNLLKRGMAVVAIGIACNFAVIAVNRGMPVDVPPDWQATGGVANTIKHHAQTGADQIYWMSDIIILRRTNEAISFGDLIMVVGLCDLTFQASRKRRRRSATSANIDLTKSDASSRPDAATVGGIVEQLEANQSAWGREATAAEPETVGRR